MKAWQDRQVPHTKRNVSSIQFSLTAVRRIGSLELTRPAVASAYTVQALTGD
jgi:hypothetical protein